MNIKIFYLFGVNVTAEHLILVSGLLILCYWLVKTRLGTRSLDNSKPRRNNMPLALPLIMWVAWVLLIAVGSTITGWLSEKGALPEWQKDLLSYSAIGGFEIILIVAMLIVARMFFARRLKGFGLEVQTIPTDLGVAFVNLWAVVPVVIALVWVVGWLGQIFQGDEFQMQLNEGLKTILTYNDKPYVKIMIIIFAVLIAPVFEEILFRGFLQSAIRKVMKGPWIGILLTSIFFAMMHPWMHWPALFALSVCLGYSYEKNGSLFRPIFIHMFFNLINILAALSQQSISSGN